MTSWPVTAFRITGPLWGGYSLWCGALFPLLLAGASCWASDQVAGDLRCVEAHVTSLYNALFCFLAGYGNISPQTNWGKIMVIAYAILGIPIMLLCLANIGDLMADMFKFVYVKVCCCGCFRRRKPDDSRPQTPDGDGQSPEQWQQNFNKQQQQDQDEYDSDEDEEPDYTEASVPLTITMGVIAFYILFGASVFSILEEWDMTESAYYCFITISTVGFGDFVPGSHGLATTNAQWEMVFTSIYMGLGLALLSMCFSLMQEEIAVKFKLLADKISLLARRNKPEHDDDSGSIVESLPPGHGKSD